MVGRLSPDGCCLGGCCRSRMPISFSFASPGYRLPNSCLLFFDRAISTENPIPAIRAIYSVGCVQRGRESVAQNGHMPCDLSGKLITTPLFPYCSDSRGPLFQGSFSSLQEDFAISEVSLAGWMDGAMAGRRRTTIATSGFLVIPITGTDTPSVPQQRAGIGRQHEPVS
jgi:hypothetical protein